MVTLLANAKGELYTCSQLQDYVFRGQEMERCSLLAFAIDTWEETYKYNAEKLQDEATKMKPGCPAHVHTHYLQDHPKWQTH